MRGSQILLVLVLSVTAAGPAFALQGSDTMTMWTHASAEDRSAVLGRILGPQSNDAQNAKVRKCLDETSTVSGHADLQIDEVAKACASQGKGDQPV